MATITETDAREMGLPEGLTPTNVVEVTESGSLVLPEGIPLSGCEFEPVGDNLVITAPDGTVTVVRGYFGMENPPELVSPGGGEMSGDMVSQLAGPVAPGQVAQAGEAAGAQPIGTVESASGTVVAIRADGTRVELQVGDPVFQGDILETSEDGAIGVILADETTFSMAEAGRMVLDEMVYDPGTQEGSINFSIVQGVFTFVSGQVAKTDPDAMTLSTPVATIGIRGTQVGIEIPDGENMRVVLMEEGDGFVGEVVVMNESGVEVMNASSDFTVISGFNVPPSPIGKMSDDDLVRTFSSNLQHIPTEGNNANDYGLQGALDEGEELGDIADDPEEDVEVGDISDPGNISEPDDPDDLALGDVEDTVDPEGDGEEIGDVDVEDLADFETAAGEPDPTPNTDTDPIPVTGGYTPPSSVEGPDLNNPDYVPPSGGGGGNGDNGPDTPPVDPLVEPLNVEPTNAAPTVGDPVAFTMNEDGTLNISEEALLASASDDDNDGLSVVNLSADGGTLTDNGNGTWTFEPSEDFNGTVDLSYDVSDGTNLTPATASVAVDAVADTTIAGPDASGAEDTAIALNITLSVDGGETVDFITISGVPVGAEISAGTDNGDGTWTLSSGDLSGLTITPPENSGADFTLGVSATLTDGSVTPTDSIAVDVTAVADSTIAGSDVSGTEDTAIALTITPSVAAGESIASVTISGVPAGATLSAGTDNGDGSWTLSESDLAGLTITPDADSNADFTLSVEATLTDGSVTASDDIAVSVSAVADTTLSASDASGDEDTAIALNIAPTVAGGESIASITISGVPSGATLSAGTDNLDGTWTLSEGDLAGLTITPNADSNTDFQLGVSAEVTDGDTTHTLTDTVDVTVNAVNDGPVASDASATGTEDVAFGGQLTATDVDGDDLTFSLAADGGAEHGTVTVNADGSFSYTPDADYNGADSFTYQVDDGAGGTTTATVSLTIDPENDDPVAVAGVGTVAEDGSVDGQLVASDIDSESLTFGLAEDGGPAHGTVTINADGSYSYTPDADYNGEDSFTFEVSDGQGGTSTATVSLNVTAVGDAAEVSATSASGAEDSAIALDISASVPDSTEGVASVTISGVPSGATLSLGTDNGNGSWTLSGTDLDGLDGLTITPDGNDNSDFTLSVAATSTDGTTGTSVDVPVSVSAVADTTLSASDASGDEDTAIALTIAPTVAGGESIASITISGVPSGATLSAGTDNGNGTWTLSSDDLAGLTITPDADSNTDFQLGVSVAVTDGDTTHTLTDTVDVTVNAVNDGPVASDAEATGTEDATYDGQLTASDVDGDDLTFSLAADGTPDHGTVTVNADGSFSYTPDADYNGADSFTYQVDDGAGGTTTATVSLTIDPENDDPVAVAGVGTVAEDGSVDGQLTASDVDGDDLTFGLAEDGGPAHGTVTINADGSYSYTPDADYNGEDSFTFEVSDGKGGTSTATVSLNVTAVGDAAEVSATSASGAEDSAIALDISASVPDSTEGVASITISGIPSGATLSLGTDNGNGSWTISGTDLGSLGDLTITPDADSNADFTLSVAATSTDGTTGTSVDVPVSVTAVADTTLSASDASGDEDTAIALNIAPTVAGGESIASITISGVPSGATLSAGTDNGNGTWTLSSDDLAGLTITPDADSNTDFQLGVSVAVTDGDTTHTLTDTVDVTVNAVNDGPVASDAEATGTEDATYDGQLTASDVDGDDLTFSLAADGTPDHGTVTVNADGSFSYTPDADYNGADSFTYQVDDGAGGTTTATVSLTIDPENDDPVAVAGTGTVAEDGSVDGQLTASDVDGDDLTFGLAEDGGPAHGTVTINADGSYSYTPDADYNGEDSFTFEVSDGQGGTSTATVSLNVTAVGDAAEVSATSASGAEDSAIALDISASVPDSTEGVASVTISGVPSGATLSLGTDNGNGSWTLSGTDLDGLDGLTITPDGNDNSDFTLSVAATSTDGTTGTSVDVPVSVSAVADTTLSASDASGDEDSAIALTIAPTVAGGESIASITISGVPSGATLSAGTDNLDGTWTLSEGDLAGLTITPDADSNTDFQLGVSAEVTDGDTTHTLTDTVDVTVNAVEDAPDLGAPGAAGAEDTSIPLNISADVPGTESLASIVIDGVPAGATLSVGTSSLTLTGNILTGSGEGGTFTADDLQALADGALTITPAPDSNDDFDLTITATSTDGGSSDATLPVSVAAVDDAPEVSVAEASGAEDTAIDLDVSASVPDSTETVASITISGVPAGASLNLGTDNGGGSWTISGDDLTNLDSLQITPTADFNGSIELGVSAVSTDGGISTTQPLTVAVSAVADVPSVSLSAASGGEDTSIGLTISASVPGSTETVESITISGMPAGATLSAGTDNGDGSWTLTPAQVSGLTLSPAADYNGSFDLSVSATSTDGSTSPAAALNVDVTPVAEDVNLTFRVSNGNTMAPEWDIDSTDGADIPAPDTFGETETATYDGSEIEVTYDDADSATVSLTDEWNSVKNIEADSDVAADVTLENFVHTDVTLGDGGDSTVTIDGAKRGDITTGDGDDTIDIDAQTNDDGWSNLFDIDSGAGDDTITVTGDQGVTDVDVTAGEGDDTVTVDGDYDQATLDGGAGDDTLTGGAGDDTLIGGAGDDTLSAGGDGDTLTGGSGDDTMDGGAGTDVAVFSGSFADYAISVNDQTGVITVVGPDGTDTLSNIEFLRFDDGDLPVDTIGGAPEITVSTAQGDEDTTIALTIEVSSNNPFDPVGSITIAGVPAGAVLSVGTDSGLTLTGNVLTGSGEGGSLTSADLAALENGALTITPAADSDADFDLSVSAQTASGVGAAAETLSVVVDAVNDGPVASDAEATGTEDTTFDGQLTASDVDGDDLTFSLAADGAPEHGTVTVNADGSFSYTPDADYNGADSFTYQVDDGAGGTTTATVSLTIDPENDDPVAVAGVGTVAEDGSVDGQLVASDIDSESLTFGLAEDGGPAHGTVTINADGSYSYTPDADYNGEDSFTFEVSDGQGGTSTATVSLNVTAVGDAAEVSATSASGAEDSAIALDISASVPDSTEGVASITISGVPSGATLSLGTDNLDGSWTLSGADLGSLDGLTITPDGNDNSDFTLSVAATSTDGTTGSSVDIPVSVAAVADTTLSASDASGDEDSAIALTIAPTVAGGESIASITISGVPSGATLSAGTDNLDGTWTLSEGDLAGLTITPDADSDADFQLGVSVAVTDGDTTHTLTDTVAVTVEAIADAPDLSVSVGEGTVTAEPQQPSADLDTGLGINVDPAQPTEPGSFDYSGNNGADNYEGGAGDDTIFGGNGGDTLYGDRHWENGDAGNDTVFGGNGSDTIGGGDGNDQLSGGAGNDTIAGDFTWDTNGAGNDVIDGGAGNDTITGGDGADQISGGTGNDTIAGDFTWNTNGASGDVIDAGAGSDTVVGGGGNDAIAGGEGDDVIFGDYGKTTNSGFEAWNESSDGNDSIDAGAGNDTVVGGAGDDTIAGGSGDDTIYADLSYGTGNDGDDIVAGGAGDDTIYGGGGSDVAVFAGTRDQYQITQNQNGSFTITDLVGGRDGTDIVSQVETFRFSDGDVSSGDLLSGESGGSGSGSAGYTVEYPLNIAASLTDTDGSETLSSITISGVPDGASLSAGTDNGGGSWTLTADQLSGLKLSVGDEVSEDFSLSVSATSTEGADGSTATTTMSIDIPVSDTNPDADMPNLTVELGVGVFTEIPGETPEPVTVFSSTFDVEEGFVDTVQGWETDSESIEVWNSEYGSTGDGGYVELNDDRVNHYDDAVSIDRTFDTVEGQTYTVTFEYSPRPGYDDDVNEFQVRVDGQTLVTLAPDGSSNNDNVWQSHTVTFVGTGEPMNLEFLSTGEAVDYGRGIRLDNIEMTTAPAATEDVAEIEYPLNISASLTDTDGSETLSNITVSGVPEGASLSAGTDNGDGSWTLTQDDLDGLTLTVSEEVGSDFNLSVSVTSTESVGGDTATATASVEVPADDVLFLSASVGEGETSSGAEPISYFSFESAPNNVVANEIEGAASAVLKGSSYDQADIVNDGKFGSAADFDGYNDYVEVPHTDNMALDSGSVTLWFNTDHADDKQGLISKDSSGFDTGGHFTVLVDDGEVQVRLQSTDESYWVSGGDVSSDSWHQATVTWGDDGLQLYVDGQMVDSSAYTGGLAGNENPWAIGANAWSTGDNNLDGLSDFFDGQIDDVAIYDRQLSTDEISALYTDGVQSLIDEGDGGTEYPLTISADLFGGDAGDTIAFVIGGVPEGATLSAGADNNDGSWTLTQNDLDGLTMTVEDTASDFSLSVSATATDSQGNVTASASTSLPIDVNDAPTLGGDGAASVGIGEEVVLTADDLHLFDDESGATDLIYELTDDVDFGTLYLNDASGNRVDLDVGDTFTQADIDLGLLSYEQDDSLAEFWDPETPEWGEGGAPVDQSNLTMPLEAEGVTITFQGENAGYENSLGWYKLDADGNPTEPQMVWANTDHNALAEGTEVTLQGLAPGEQFGFFIIQDGNDDYSWLQSQMQSGNDMQFGSDGSLQFLDGNGGVAQSVGANDLFYTGSSSLNPDGINHALSGVQDGELMIGFEDLTGGGDNDFNDLTFSVKYEGVAGPQTAASDSFTFTAEDGAGATIVDHSSTGEGYTVTDGEATFDITIDQA